jgi:iron complex transport system substrate-binding protein
LGVADRGALLAKSADATFAEVDRIVAAVPAAQRPKVYLARGADGLETGSRGSINTEIIERVGATNVVEGLRQRGGIVTASPEQIIAWAPDTIVTLDEAFSRTVKQKPEWAPVPAVAKDRVFLAPRLPFGFIDSPPSVNRLIGLTWLLKAFYPAQFTDDLRARVRDFYQTFYQVNLSDADLDRLLQGS